MTDIIKDFEQKDSGELMSFLRNNPNSLQKNISFFKEELKNIGASNPALIALGRDTYKILSKYLKKEFSIFTVTHYSASISKEKLHEEFQLIISKLENKEIDNKKNNNKPRNGTLERYFTKEKNK